MLKNKGLKLNNVRDVIHCLYYLINKCPYARQIFFELEGLDELEPWMKNQNQEIRQIA